MKIENTRRDFIKKGLIGGMALTGLPSALQAHGPCPEAMQALNQSSNIKIPERFCFKPLETIRIETPKADSFTVYDAKTRPYFQSDLPIAKVPISGALGYHTVMARDRKGRLVDITAFKVDCESDIEDASGRYKHLLYQLKLEMYKSFYRPGNVKGLDNELYRGFVTTSRDHVHGLKGMKYYYGQIKEWMDVYAEHQPEDGMIWDFFMNRDKKISHFEMRFSEKFWKVLENGQVLFARQPVMNDLEYMFILGIYWTWKTTGDDDWMANKLDNCLKAMDYAMSSPYTWSEKYKLIKRPFCIDLWDFSSEYDAALVGGDDMLAIPDVSEYGVMHGDNTGMIEATGYLSKMLERAGRQDDARRVAQNRQMLLDNLYKLSWNGSFFTHFVGENPDFERPFGVDQSKQVSLSNAYALNRGIDHEKCVQIIKTYQSLRSVEPNAQAEWFCMYPPFPRGFGKHTAWHYVNGGISTMVAGELAHGAFEHGFEDYAVDILDRLCILGEKYDQMQNVWRGIIPDWPDREFVMLNLREIANTDFYGTVKSKAIPWTQEGENDLHNMPVGKQKLAGIEFDVIDPADNQRKACIALSTNEPYTASASIPVRQKAQSIYLLHCMSKGKIAGTLTFNYSDGSQHSQYIRSGIHIDNWWMPKQPNREKAHWDPHGEIAWRGSNAKSKDIGVIAYGFENPQADKEIASIDLKAADDGALWMVLGITLSDYPVFFMPNGLSGGIPHTWSCGAVVYAMYEGLCGIYDEDRNYHKIRLSPRWLATNEKKASVCAKYEAGGGYVSYTYERHPDRMELTVATSAAEQEFEILLPKGKFAKKLTINGKKTDFQNKSIEQSAYIVFKTANIARQQIALHW